jgi:hypothetical protein
MTIHRYWLTIHRYWLTIHRYWLTIHRYWLTWRGGTPPRLYSFATRPIMQALLNLSYKITSHGNLFIRNYYLCSQIL